MHMIWALLCVSALLLSATATGLIVFKLYKDWDVRASSVRWLFAAFFTYQFISTTARLIYFSWLTVVAQHVEENDNEDLVGQAMVETELYRMGTSAVLKLGKKQNGWITAVIIVGDTTLFGITVWIATLVYELSKLVALSMDRGEKHERATIRLYSRIGHSSIAVYLTVQVVLAIIFTGYSSYAYSLLLVVYLVQIIVLIYMMTVVVLLKIRGRNYESVHGHFVASPLYRRLKWIMLVYALFAFQFQFSSLIFFSILILIHERCFSTTRGIPALMGNCEVH
ncbi:Adenylate cyclase [Phytophthora cinnamomi]|uniref:Adenylate cyclase n=1 Tax=Phytophthora cinnamomi TaxID=4785 RepID=UPI0035597CBD|nr:Adenylate cyclase [Phytophthora cinnamomi]